VYALQYSWWLINNSNLSVNPGSSLCHLARGDIIYGWSIIKVGLTQSDSKKCPTNLSINLAVVLGDAQTTWCILHYTSKNS